MFKISNCFPRNGFSRCRCFSATPYKGKSASKGGSDKGKGRSSDKPVSGLSFNPEYVSHTSMYDVRKYGHYLPGHSITTPFEAIQCMPTGLFRCTYGEILGPGADKCGPYPVPEYFSYHHMTFYDFHLLLRKLRMPSPITNRKP